MQFALTVPALEDKIVQKAAGELLSAIYEQDFLDCSYRFQPGRGAHGGESDASSGAARLAAIPVSESLTSRGVQSLL